jgi:excisionase family DNA binding protein
MPTTEVAAKLRIDRKTVSRLCAEGKLPATSISGRWFVDPADLQEFRQIKREPHWWNKARRLDTSDAGR